MILRLFLEKELKEKIGNNEIVAGNKKLLNENYKNLKNKVQHHLDAGATAIYLCMNNQLIGAVLLSDLLRNNAVDVILNLKSMNVTPVLMSGDNQIQLKLLLRKSRLTITNITVYQKIKEITLKNYN